jgi:lipopolysaccharide/colanic/teichoic acid biosynthesis glycosyltransferase
MNELTIRDEAFIEGLSERIDSRYGKRFADVLSAFILLVALAPLLILIAIAIKLETSGPVIFRQERMGSRPRRSNGATVWEPTPFVFLKFRTMSASADPSLHRAHVEAFVRGRLGRSNENASFKLDGDPRVTRVGGLLRKTSLDELPQLINVIRGEMSLVGPRPVPLYEFALYDERQQRRMAAIPGLTGLWQVRGRCDVSFEEMIELDLAYVRDRSFWLDVKILFLTIPAVVGGRGAG